MTNNAYAYRNDLRISSVPVESGMAHLVNRRMGEKQSMRWLAHGPYHLLQVGCAVLNGELEKFFANGSLDFARIRVRSSVLYDSRPQV